MEESGKRASKRRGKTDVGWGHSCKWREQKVVAESVTQKGRAQERSPVSSLRPLRGLGSHTHPSPLLNPQSTSQAQEHRSPGHLRTELLSLYSPGWSLEEVQPTSFAPRVPFLGPAGGRWVGGLREARLSFKNR